MTDATNEPDPGRARRYHELVSTKSGSSAYLEALIARDKLRALIEAGELSPLELDRVAGSDAELRKWSDTLSAADRAQLAVWRRSVAPPDDAWWWRADGSSVGWPIVAAVMFAVSATLVTSFATKTLAENADAWGIIAVAAQALLTVGAGASFTAAGKRWMSVLTRRVGIGEGAPWQSSVVALALLIVTALCWYYLPTTLAREYNRRARAACPNNEPCNNIPEALRYFTRAASLPTDAATASVVHYNLGRVYELAHDYDSAVRHYSIAVQQDPDSPSALNNWAWLLLLKDEAPGVALTLLDEAARRVAPRVRNGVPYQAAPSIYKNRGLAHFRLGFLELAAHDLRESIALQARRNRPDIPAPHCILAAVLDQSMQRIESVAEARRCIELIKAGSNDPEAPKLDPRSYRTAIRLAES